MGTTSEKLTYLNTTKTLIKEELNLGGANITNEPFRAYKGKLEGIYKDFLANGTDTLWNNWEKVTGTGETITLNNTIEAKMDFVYKGNTYQYSTTGKNLFNVNATHENNLSNAGITATFNSDGTITVNGTKNANYKAISYNITLPAGTYYFSGCPSGGSGGGYSIIVQTTNEISSQIFDTGNGATFTLTEQKKISFFPVRVGADAVTFNNTVFKPMIARVPVTYNDYEPYTGNQPSPSPDYPQDIQVVSGDNTIKVEGKNLVNPSDIYDGYPTGNNGWKIGFNPSANSITYRKCAYVVAGQSYTLSWNPNTPKATGNRDIKIVDNNNIILENFSYSNTNNNRTRTFTPTYSGWVYASLDTNATEVQIEKGSTATTYEPYQGNTYNINLPSGMELCKIGTYQDRIYKDNGKWYLNKQIGKVVLDGSENWGINATNQFYISAPNLATLLNNNYLKPSQPLMNYFGYYNSAFGKDNSGGIARSGALWISFNSSYNLTDTTALSTWLSTHNTIVYYVLATPTTTEITDSTLIEQLEAIKKSYNNQTNISQENSKEAFILDVTALGN